jgi:hypothetical protein
MDDQSPKSLFSKLMPDDLERLLGQADGKIADASADITLDGTQESQNSAIATVLMNTLGTMGGGAQAELNQFLTGKGALHKTTQNAITTGGKASARQIEDFLVKQFNLAKPIASVIAPLIIRIFPSIGKGVGQETTTSKTKTTTRAKTAQSTSKTSPASKPKTSKTKKTGTSSSTSKTKTTSKTTPKSTAKKPTAKRKTSTTRDTD